jgi:hypothetical protein
MAIALQTRRELIAFRGGIFKDKEGMAIYLLACLAGPGEQWLNF